MGAKLKVSGTNYQTLKNYVGDAYSKVIGHNTTAYDHGDHVTIRFHQTDIVKVYATGDRIDFDTGGWESVTTKQRMSLFSPPGMSPFQKDYVWYVSDECGPNLVDTRWSLVLEDDEWTVKA